MKTIYTFLRFYLSTFLRKKLIHTIIFRKNVETQKRKNSKMQAKKAYLKIGLDQFLIGIRFETIFNYKIY